MLRFIKKHKQKKQSAPVIKKQPIPQDYDDIIPISQYLKNETGITFDNQLNILKSKITLFCKQQKINSFSELLSSINREKTIKQQLINHITINETFFYREINQINEVVKQIQNTKTNVSILCAPSSSGEEPYSIAIALLEAKIPTSRFEILGIDINSDIINKAQKGIYSQRNLKKLNSNLIDKYFIKDGDTFLLSEDIKSLVSFKTINIFDNSFKNIGKFDYIFSRNMLIYFDKNTKEKAKKILQELRNDEKQKIFFGHADLF